LGDWEEGSQEAERRTEGGKMQQYGMKVKIIERMQTCTHWSIERERNLVVVVVWSEGEGRRDKAGRSIGSEDGLV
jgi:hypothetical protein